VRRGFAGPLSPVRLSSTITTQSYGRGRGDDAGRLHARLRGPACLVWSERRLLRAEPALQIRDAFLRLAELVVQRFRLGSECVSLGARATAHRVVLLPGGIPVEQQLEEVPRRRSKGAAQPV
jgi:hypothetical protein